jgi:Holliday junction resolvase RusA-like endonuclease
VALLKGSAPEWPVARPDALKLARAAEDALTGIVWADDAQIVVERLGKVFGPREGCRVRVRRLG